MSDIFTVVLDLSRVNNDSKSNQMYLAMADTTKMKKIYDFKRYIQFLFSLGCSVELFHEDVRLPDLEDIRVLSHLDVVQVRPENVEEKKCEGKKLISKSKGINEKRGDGDPRPMPGDSVANYNYIDSKENACNLKSHEPGKIVQAQEVSGFGDHGKAEMSCGPSFPPGNIACSTVQKPMDNMMKNMFDMQENKTFRLGEKTGMADNLKLAALLQNRYYGWCGEPDSNIVTGRSHFQKSNEMPDSKSVEKPYMFKSSGKFTDDCGVGNKPYIPNEGDVNIPENTFKGTIRSPVKSREANNRELCGREPHPHQVRSKSCSRSRPDHHSGPYGPRVIPGTVQKPFTGVKADYREKNSCAEGSFVRKPLTVDEALKILTEVAAERSKTLSGNNPAFNNDGRKNQFRGVFKTFKANPAGGSQNFQKGNFKHPVTSRNPAMLDKDGTAMVAPDGFNPKAVSCQPHVPKQDMKKPKVNKKAGSAYKNQGNALLKSCEKLCENQSQKTGNTGKFEAKTGAQNKNMCKANISTETGDKSQGVASMKGCGKTDGNQGGKTESTGKVEAETGAPNPLLQCHPTEKKKRSKNKKKAISENKSVSHTSISDCEHFDSCRGNDKVGVAGKTESETAPSNNLVKYGNVKDKMAPDDGFSELSNSGSAFLEECLYSLALNDVVKGKPFDGGERAGSENSPSGELNSSGGETEPGVRLPHSRPDNPTGVDTSSENTSDIRFPGKDTRPNSRRDLQTTDPVNIEDEGGAIISNSSANSFRDLCLSGGAVAQDAATYVVDLQGKTIVRDDTAKTVSKDDNKDKSESHGSPATNKVITVPNIITDNTSVQYTKDINVSGDGGEGGLVSSQGRVQLARNHSQDGFRTEDAAALTGVGTGSVTVGGTGTAPSGSRSVPTHESLAPPLRCVGSVKTEQSQDLHRPEGPGRDTKIGQLLSSLAGSSGKSAGVGTVNDPRSDAGKKECVIS